MCGILGHAKVPRSNLTRDHRTALKELMEQEDEQEDELIVSADKGNATMMMR